jgi:hypothetical protein
MSQFNDIMIDYESCGYAPDGLLLDCAAIAFNPDHNAELNFDALCRNAFYVKFDTDKQPDRVMDEKIVDFWVNQSEEAREILEKTPYDISVDEGTQAFVRWCKNNNVDPFKSRIWSRGNEFDMGILTDCLRKLVGCRDIEDITPVCYWNVRDVRTALEENLGRDNFRVVPMPKDALKGFVLHNSVHDCAKAILELQYSRKIAWGIYEPTENT